MKLKLKIPQTGGDLFLLKDEKEFDRLFYTRDRANKYFTIAWNYGEAKLVTIDSVQYNFLPNTVLTLLFNQSFHFEDATDIIAWQFNREFYCIMDHDAEVSCVGFLFGSTDHIFVRLDDDALQKMRLLSEIFTTEFNTADTIQQEMLLVLLKRLIIFITKLARSEYIPVQKMQDDKFHIIRKFNLLVEADYHREHSVSYYAQQLNKSPKTLSNLFAIYNHKTPQQVIHERILVEARRLLYYTDRSVKQITYDLGFEDTAYFSNFFKRNVSVSPLEFRNKKEISPAGK